MDKTNERWPEAELWRLRAVLLEAAGRRDDAEPAYRRAIDLAERLGARGWHLRAAAGLARQLSEDGRAAAAREILAPVYANFTEGLDTGDLLDARALLDELS